EHIGLSQHVKSCVESPRNAGLPVCYGAAKDAAAWMARDIMGCGKEVHTCDAGPWLNAIEYHTFWADLEWRAVRTEMPPLDVTVRYPRPPGEAPRKFQF